MWAYLSLYLHGFGFLGIGQMPNILRPGLMALPLLPVSFLGNGGVACGVSRLLHEFDDKCSTAKWKNVILVASAHYDTTIQDASSTSPLQNE